MPSPFPGMDPYLEAPSLWQEFHNAFIYVVKRAMNEAMPPRFIARSDTRLYVSSVPPHNIVPDVTVFQQAANQPSVVPGLNRGGAAVAVAPGPMPRPADAPELVRVEERREAYIEVLDRENSERVVMVVEVLSPDNKAGGRGRDEYLRKRDEVLASDTHLLEIDLLRAGQHTVAPPQEGVAALGPHDYLVSLLDARRTDSFLVWRRSVRDPLPDVELPLTPDAGTFRLDFQSAFTRCYDENRYAELLAARYAFDPQPPLAGADAAWADALLRHAGLRG